MNNESTYWIALTHLPRWGSKRINGLVVKFHHEEQITIEDFFNLDERTWLNTYGLIPKEVGELNQLKADLANFSFLAETMQNEGYEVIPIISKDYSPTLKANLKAAASPPVLYVKGNKQVMHERSIAIVGSRNAADISLQFTDNIARLASKDYKVVVSGFAKGVDKQALDSAIRYKGQSIIVLPQGIMTFDSGYKKYYRQIVDGDVLVLSVFQPKAPWQASLAMARNPIIYGLAAEIFVAESSDSGGTWSGVIDGLRKERKIFIRMPEPEEKNANRLLIQKGAVPVDMDGNILEIEEKAKETGMLLEVNEPFINHQNAVLQLLSQGEFNAKEIIDRLKLDISEHALREYLKSEPKVETLNKRSMRFRIKKNNQSQTKLF